MILLKIYNFKKIKLKIIVFLLIIFISLVLFSSFNNWGEKNVFKALRAEITLIIPPGQPSIVYVNGEKIGKQDSRAKEVPLIHKIKSNEIIDLRIEPLLINKNEVPIEKTLTFEEGELVIPKENNFWNHMSINKWPNGVYEIMINLPIKTNIDLKKDKELIKEDIADLDGDNDLEEIKLIKQDKYYFLEIEGKNKVVLKNYEEKHFSWNIKDINNNGKNEIILKGNFGNGHKYVEVFQYDEGIKRLFWDYGDDIAVFENGRILIGKRLFDTVEHYKKTFYKWKEDQYEMQEEIINWWKGNPKWPTDKENTIKAFFESYKLGLMKEAKGYLAPEYQENGEMKKIANKVDGNWRKILLAKYYFLEDNSGENIYMAFSYDTDIHQKYNSIKIYEFSFIHRENQQGPWKIKEIKKEQKE